MDTNWVDKMLQAMINSDRNGAQNLVDAFIHENQSAENVIHEMLDPALVRVGKLWDNESVSLAQTFIAAKIAEDVLLRCLPQDKNVHTKGLIVIGNIEDDYHSLGRRIVSSFLKASGWDVHDLGNDVPAEQFVDEALKIGAHIIGVSAMMQTTALNIKKVRILLDERGLSSSIKLAVGGAVFNWRPELVKVVGADGTAKNAADVGALCDLLLSHVEAGERT